MKERVKQAHARLKAAHNNQPALFWLRLITVVGVALLFIIKRNFWTPDTLFLVLLAVFVVFGQGRAFLLRFAPFVILLLAYDSFRSIADQLNTYVNFSPMINFDRWLFNGALPTNALQSWLWHGSLQWYDFYFYFLYTLHFVMPILLAVLFWKLRPKLYWPFVTVLVVLSFAAFFTFIIFPAAPPWMASDMQYIPHVQHISTDVWQAMGIDNPSVVYHRISPNPVAAVPSLHSAYPLLFVLFLARAFGWRRMWWTMLYPISMWIGVVYLGEHYVFDVLLGILFAIAAYKFTLQLFEHVRNSETMQAHYQRGYAWGYQRARRSRNT